MGSRATAHHRAALLTQSGNGIEGSSRPASGSSLHTRTAKAETSGAGKIGNGQSHPCSSAFSRAFLEHAEASRWKKKSFEDEFSFFPGRMVPHVVDGDAGEKSNPHCLGAVPIGGPSL